MDHLLGCNTLRCLCQGKQGLLQAGSKGTQCVLDRGLPCSAPRGTARTASAAKRMRRPGGWRARLFSSSRCYRRLIGRDYQAESRLRCREARERSTPFSAHNCTRAALSRHLDQSICFWRLAVLKSLHPKLLADVARPLAFPGNMAPPPVRTSAGKTCTVVCSGAASLQAGSVDCRRCRRCRRQPSTSHPPPPAFAGRGGGALRSDCSGSRPSSGSLCVTLARQASQGAVQTGVPVGSLHHSINE